MEIILCVVWGLEAACLLQENLRILFAEDTYVRDGDIIKYSH